MLTAPEIDEARQDYADTFLSQRCRILRASTGSKSAYGGREYRLQTVATSVPCQLVAPGRTSIAEGGTRSISLGDWDVCLPIGTAVALEDEVHIDNVAYEVVGSDTGRAEALCLRAYCRRRGAS